VLIVLFDQMRPEYATRFNMPNFRMLQGDGRTVRNAYLEYMGSETVIAHNVLMSGQEPRPDGNNSYGTSAAFPSWIYPLDGNRFVPGTDSAHLGGDTWVADAAMEMMAREDWSGMFVTMGGIDKAGHMWGAEDDVQSAPGSVDYQTHVQANAENADVQLGRMLDKLDQLGQLDDTLVVLTADHGATGSGPAPTYPGFYGKRDSGSSSSDTNWYYGPTSMPTPYNNPSPALMPLINTGNVQFSYQSTSIQTWLTDGSPAKVAEAVGAMQTLPGVIATYWRDGSRFRLADTNPMSWSERRWWRKTGQSIVNTMAAANGPDVVGLLKDGVSYGAVGDHGGASQEVQRVPMVFWSADMRHGRSTRATFRTPDVMPTILRAMGIRLTYPVDGRARSLR
jgi:hypothetical protein